MGWKKSDISSQTGKVAIVTGSYGGLGYQVVLALAEAGATVVIAGRSESKASDALKRLQQVCPAAKVSFSKLDLGSLESVKAFCKDFHSKHEVLDILINNAGIMMPPKRETSQDGFEISFQTNHLSHFALTAQLLPALRRSPSPRVVNVSSLAARQGNVRFDDLQFQRGYDSWKVYAQSKLANLLFTQELQRRSDEGGWGLTAVTAHPGFSRTDLLANGPGLKSPMGYFGAALGAFFMQSAVDGALPLLFAAISPDAKPAEYYGPNGFYEMRGVPSKAHIPPRGRDVEVARKLWDVSVNLSNTEWA